MAAADETDDDREAASMFRPRVSLKNLMIGLAFLACALALFGVNRLAESRERDLRMRLAESRSREFALKGMSSLLTDRGIDVLRQASDVELLPSSCCKFFGHRTVARATASPGA